MTKLEIRLAKEEDKKYLIEWLMQPNVLEWFPMCNLMEVEDAAKIWISYIQYDAVLTVLCDNVPCGIANLYIQTNPKLAHQCLFPIIVDEKYRGRGIGTYLLENLIKLAKEKFKIELLHLEVYSGNPAIHLYERLGFVKYGVHKRFLKKDGKYWDKILMQKKL
ncbi:MAG: GNAT family N-acetyltransferase [Chlamydiae bacterium]|nr:GNAT family N-acetyltransferase [Chlamydiota bacterium]